MFDSTISGQTGGSAAESTSSTDAPSTGAVSGPEGTSETATQTSTTSPASTSTSGPGVEPDSSSGAAADSSSSSSSSGGEPGCGGLWWEADFDTDPTTLDVNEDGTEDWVVRPGGQFPVAELAGGVWSVSESHVPLDTRPRDDFVTRTLVSVQMRTTEPGGDRGATFWINVDYTAGSFAAIFVNLPLNDGAQRLRLMTRSDPSQEVLLTEVEDLSTEFVRVDLEIDPVADEVTLWIDRDLQGTFDFPVIPSTGNNDRFATLLAWGTDAEFRHVRVQRCDAE
jgi:hypothetical protein